MTQIRPKHIPRRSRRLSCVLAAAVVLGATTVPGAHASFPGSNGVLAFQVEAVAGDHTQTDVYTMAADGSALTPLTATPDLNEFGPVWNPAGTMIAFWRTNAPFGPGSLWVMKRNGAKSRRLTKGVDARDPAWNADGTRLVYTNAQNGSHLWTLRVSDGLDRQQLTTGTGVDFEPAWSPDGTRIAFTRGSDSGDPGDIAVLDVATGTVQRLTHAPAYDHQVSWSPDGQQLVFERDFDSSSSIYRINADGSNVVQLTHGPYFDLAPAYSPDGTYVVFGSDRSGGFLSDLWMMKADGTHRHIVSDLADSAGVPDWQALAG